ncbi:TPA: hypothetical protein SBV50_001640 [Campylobacter coli]|nr:hypothetical protein [Campylobacter coli]HEF9150704.1 hypothetical protein [Campylobacter coli]
MEEKNKYNQCLLLNGYEFLDFENTKNTTLKEWLKDENFLLFIKSIPKDYIFNIDISLKNLYGSYFIFLIIINGLSWSVNQR